MKLNSMIAQARELVLYWLKGDEAALPGACMYHAIAMNKLFNISIGAGSYSWKFTHFDNGTNPTHFSCMFDDLAKSQAHALLLSGDTSTLVLPEMHVFNVFNGKVLDLTTCYLPEFVRAGGLVFEDGLVPPPFLYDSPTGPGDQWIYTIDPVATQLARTVSRKERWK